MHFTTTDPCIGGAMGCAAAPRPRQGPCGPGRHVVLTGPCKGSRRAAPGWQASRLRLARPPPSSVCRNPRRAGAGCSALGSHRALGRSRVARGLSHVLVTVKVKTTRRCFCSVVHIAMNVRADGRISADAGHDRSWHGAHRVEPGKRPPVARVGAHWLAGTHGAVRASGGPIAARAPAIRRVLCV